MVPCADPVSPETNQDFDQAYGSGGGGGGGGGGGTLEGLAVDRSVRGGSRQDKGGSEEAEVGTL